MTTDFANWEPVAEPASGFSDQDLALAACFRLARARSRIERKQEAQSEEGKGYCQAAAGVTLGRGARRRTLVLFPPLFYLASPELSQSLWFLALHHQGRRVLTRAVAAGDHGRAEKHRRLLTYLEKRLTGDRP